MREIPISTEAVHELTRCLFLGASLVLATTFLAGCDGGAGGEQNGGGGASGSGPSSSASPAPPFSGTFEGTLNGEPVKLVLDQQGDNLSGRITSGLQVSTVTGTASGKSAKGRLQDPDGTAGDVQLVRDDETLNMTLTVIDPSTGMSHTLNIPLKPVGGGSTPAAQAGNSNDAGERDPMLVGRWRHTDAGGSGGFSYAIDTHFAINEDGSYRYGDSKAAAGDASSTTIAEGEGAEVGQWRTEDRILYLKAGADTEWSPVARYYAEDNRMMLTYNNGNKKVWERE